jgi:hypothetical protein
LRFLRATLVATAVIAPLIGASAHAVEAVKVRLDAPVIDLGGAVEWHAGDGDRLQVTAAPDAGDIVRRIEVLAHEAGVNWAVFALANTSDQHIERLIVVPHSETVGSRVVSITPSSGDRLERQDTATADVFRVPLGPGVIITYLVELRADRLPQIYLWESDAYKASHNR